MQRIHGNQNRACPDLDLDGDRLREECGVFGIFGHPDAAAITALGLHALQHRGQEAAGIVSFDGQRFHSERRMGLVGDAFSRREVIERLPGHMAVGHVRYSTTGETILRNVQPLFAELNTGGFAVGHNGNLTNGLSLRRQLVREGAMMQSTTDTEVILHLVAHSRRNRFIDRFIEALRALEGAYSLVGAHQQETDRRARPARHPAAGAGRARRLPDPRLRDLRARHHRREVRPRRGERRGGGVRRGRRRRSHKPFPPSAAAAVHLRIHLLLAARFDRRRPTRLRRPQGNGRRARPRSAGARRRGRAGARFRRSGGDRLCAGSPAFRTSSASSATTMSAAPSSSRRNRSAQLGVRLKHSANRAVVAGKRIVLVDDSIVRGTTSTRSCR